jgi:hypothetical protein
MKYSFGKTKAAIKLEEMVSGKRKIRRRLSAILSEYTHQMMSATMIRDPYVARLCLRLLQQHTLNRIKQMDDLTFEMAMFAKNVIVSRYRAHLNGFNIVIAMRIK